MEKYVEDYVYKVKSRNNAQNLKESQKQRVGFARNEVRTIFSKVWFYILIGVILGGIFHGFVPEEFIMDYFGKDNFWALPSMILLGIPLYINVLGTLPIVESLVVKGLPIVTALAFMMAVTALSLPEIIILKKVLKQRLINVFVLIVGVSILVSGFIFNLIL